MVGSSAAMHEVYQLAERVASTDATVLVSGESGTGKELVAESIHRLSHRSSGPFVPINCGAVASELIESELFGHERGSFTGAERRHRGVFERAHMGTLLLDEITEMSAQLQVKLLRALETSSIRRVGGDAEIDVDVRVIAATNRDAGEAVADGRLREDLYYRLKVFPITLPPLRDRVGDIPLLVRHFLDQLGREELEIEPPALERLERFHWPGNVRELRNVVERCSILADDVITEATLPPEIRSGEAGMPRLQAPIGTSLDEIVREHTLATLEHFGGDKPRAAETLGISLKTLYNRLNRYLDE
jgi:transcriptional regulator with PAS, ATPase and Fis domain